MGLLKHECARIHAKIHQSRPPKVPTRIQKKNQDALHRCNHPMYGTKTRYADTKTEELVDAQSTIYVQKVCGTLL